MTPAARFGAVLALTVWLAGFAPTPAQSAETAPVPVVVELFTSQGCSTCPPADAFLAELAKRPDLIALEFHVGFWDFLGWSDPLAKVEFTDRQHAYIAAMGARYPYTPQMVIGGRRHEIGSNRERVEQGIAQVRTGLSAQPSVTMRRIDARQLEIVIGAAAAEVGHDLMLVAYDSRHETEVDGGKNKGRRLVNTQVVRQIARIGGWDGDAVVMVVPIPQVDGGCAVLVQKTGHGPIVAAGSIAFNY